MERGANGREMPWQVKMLVWVLGTHILEENQFPQVSSDHHMHAVACMAALHVCMHADMLNKH